MIYATLNDFYLTDEQLHNSPSRQDGVDEATENQLRQFGCDLIQEAGILLRLPQAVMATAQILVQRFYCKKSLRKLDVKVAAMAAFWLGAKLEEVIEIDSPTKLRLRDVLSVFYRIIRRREGRPLDVLDPYSKKFEEMKAEVVRAERVLLRSFGFIVHVEQPHRFVLNYTAMLELPHDLSQEAWNIANDSLRTTLCVRYKAEVQACGIVFLAARRLKVPMPESPPWWEAFQVSQQQVHSVVATLLELYSRPRAEYVPLGRDVTTRAQQVGQASPKTANVTPTMRSPLPEPSVAASGAVTAGGGAGGDVSAKPAGSGGVSTANGVALDKDKSPAPKSVGTAPAANGSAPAASGKGERPSGAAQQQQSGSQAARARQRSRSRSRSRSVERREHKHHHRHRSRGDSRDRRRDYDDRRDSGRRSERSEREDRDRRRPRDEHHRDRDRDRHRPSSRR